MNKFSFLWPKRWNTLMVVAFLGLACGFMAWAVGISALRSNTQEFEPNIVNKTTSLQVVSATKTLIDREYVLLVTLRNTSTKNIVAYTYLAGQASNTNDYTFGKKLLGPGESEVEYVPYENLKRSPISYQSPGHLIIAAVWFEGGSGEGDNNFVSKLSEQFEGARDQAKLIIPLLRKAADSNQDDGEALNGLESEAARLPKGDDALDRSIDYKEGRKRTQSSLMARISELKSQRNPSGSVNPKRFLPSSSNCSSDFSPSSSHR